MIFTSGFIPPPFVPRKCRPVTHGLRIGIQIQAALASLGRMRRRRRMGGMGRRWHGGTHCALAPRLSGFLVGGEMGGRERSRELTGSNEARAQKMTSGTETDARQWLSR